MRGCRTGNTQALPTSFSEPATLLKLRSFLYVKTAHYGRQLGKPTSRRLVLRCADRWPRHECEWKEGSIVAYPESRKCTVIHTQICSATIVVGLSRNLLVRTTSCNHTVGAVVLFNPFILEKPCRFYAVSAVNGDGGQREERGQAQTAALPPLCPSAYNIVQVQVVLSSYPRGTVHTWLHRS